jgi:hypothetical protein
MCFVCLLLYSAAAAHLDCHCTNQTNVAAVLGDTDGAAGCETASTMRQLHSRLSRKDWLLLLLLLLVLLL